MRRSAIGDREEGKYQNQNDWSNSQSTEDYHAYITRMQKMLSVADYPAFQNLHGVFKNENGLLVETDDQKHGKNQNQKGLQWQTHSTDDYHAYVTKVLRMPSIADENGNNIVEMTEDREENQNGCQWPPHTTDEYHAHVTKMLRTPSIVYTDQK